MNLTVQGHYSRYKRRRHHVGHGTALTLKGFKGALPPNNTLFYLAGKRK